jgi:hypothetical protein
VPYQIISSSIGVYSTLTAVGLVESLDIILTQHRLAPNSKSVQCWVERDQGHLGWVNSKSEHIIKDYKSNCANKQTSFKSAGEQSMGYDNFKKIALCSFTLEITQQANLKGVSQEVQTVCKV